MEIVIKLIEPCYETKLIYNAETWMNIREKDLKKLERNQHDIYKRIFGIPNAAIQAEFGIVKSYIRLT